VAGLPHEEEKMTPLSMRQWRFCLRLKGGEAYAVGSQQCSDAETLWRCEGREAHGIILPSNIPSGKRAQPPKQKENSPMKCLSSRKGFTLVEVMIVVAIIALLAAIAIPNVLRGRTTAGESSSVGTLHSLVAGLEMYRAVNNAYPDAWEADMYTTAEPDYGPAGFNTLGAVQGYTYAYTPAAGTTPQTYTLTGTPTAAGTTGSRAFFVDATGRVRHCRCEGTTCTAATVAAVTIEAVPGACG
jgi:prepilin-type N-terminal cleavage/methylation domain-containing protein